MKLKNYLETIALNWNEQDQMSSPNQKLLRNANNELTDYYKPPYIVKGSGGEGKVTFTPWIAWFNPESTESAKEGIYVVYLYSRSMKYLNLSLNQGVRNKLEREGKKSAHLMLQSVAEGLKKQLKIPKSLRNEMILEYDGDLQQAYISGTITNIRYDLNNLPSAEQMEEDLITTLNYYDDAISITDHPDSNLPTKKISNTKQAKAQESGASLAPAQTRTVLIESLVSDPKVKKYIKDLYNGLCQICKNKLPVPKGFYSEAAHIKAKKDGGDDHESNVLSLCANCHSQFDQGGLWIEQDLSVSHFNDGVIGKLFVDEKHKLNNENFKEHKDLIFKNYNLKN